MAHLIEADTVTTAWLASAQYLHEHGQQEFNLVVVMGTPCPEMADLSIVQGLDHLLKCKDKQRVETVANTIFPEQIARTSRDRHHLYQRYKEMLPILHRDPKNHRGLYFERLIDYPLKLGEQSTNQVETIIRDLQAQARRPNSLRFVYEANVFAPGKDRLPQGFPCLSSLSFQLDDQQLRLSATYRNQYYIAKALGNFLGLARLQRFIASEAGLEQGPLTVDAVHAQINEKGVSKRDVGRLICECQQAFDNECRSSQRPITSPTVALAIP